MQDFVSPLDKAYFLLTNKPYGYPEGHPVEPNFGFPILKQLTLDVIPAEMCAFNDLGRAACPESTLVHFHKFDGTFHDVIREPLKFGSRAGHFKAICSPDITLSDGMADWDRAKNTFVARAVAATWESQGIEVIPTLRWRLPADYDVVVCGLPKHSVFAVSTYGSVRDAELKHIFIDGLREMVKRLEPIAIVVYGTGIKNIQDIVGPGIDVYIYPTPTQKIRFEKYQAKFDANSTLF